MSAGVAAVIVNYNAREDLLACVASLGAAGVHTVVVVDNGSTDGSGAALADRFPHVKWVAAGRNLGFGRAANIGAALAAVLVDGLAPGSSPNQSVRPDSAPAMGLEYLLICNPDVIVGPEAVGPLVEYLQDNPKVAVVGPRVVDPKGTLYPSARLFPDLVDSFGHGLLGQLWKTNPFTRRYKMSDWDHSEARPVDWVSGACFLARASAWEAVGGFDRSYFMYMEDVDLCWRLGLSGWAVAYQPASQVSHVQGVSADLHPYRMLVAHHVSMGRFALRSTRPERRWALPVVFAGLAGRLVLTLGAKAFARAGQGRATPPSGAG